MNITEGLFGRLVRVTEERWNHITLSHPEMIGQYNNIVDTLQKPDEVIESKSDKNAELYYKKYFQTPVGDKFLCVVIKASGTDYFMLTAYFTDKIKIGNSIWKRK